MRNLKDGPCVERLANDLHSDGHVRTSKNLILKASSISLAADRQLELVLTVALIMPPTLILLKALFPPAARAGIARRAAIAHRFLS